MNRSILILIAVLAAAVPSIIAGNAPQATGREPIVGGPCEGCEAVFEGLPDTVPTASKLAPACLPGEPMRISGRVVDSAGAPVPGTIVYAYHTNHEGIYPRAGSFPGRAAARHGALRGWASADDSGRYRFETVRPAGYPGTDIPQHVHMHVIEPGRCTYYIDDIVFRDDPRLTPEKVGQFTPGRGGTGLVTPVRDRDGAWLVNRDIVLGKGIPGYPRPGGGGKGF